MTTSSDRERRPDVIIGVGNDLREDDGIGLAVAAELGRVHPTCRLVLRSGDLSDLLLCWMASDHVLLVDACRTGSTPGAVQRIDPDRLAADPRHSTHSMGVASALALARALNRMPAVLTVIGVEASRLGRGSRELDQADLDQLAARVWSAAITRDGTSVSDGHAVEAGVSDSVSDRPTEPRSSRL